MGEMLERRYTRTYDVEDGPWPVEDEATVEFDDKQRRVVVRGAYHGGSTNRECCVRGVRCTPADGVLAVDIGEVGTAGEFAFDVGQRVHYEVAVEFTSDLPDRLHLRHLTRANDVQFSMTAEREQE